MCLKLFNCRTAKRTVGAIQATTEEAFVRIETLFKLIELARPSVQLLLQPPSSSLSARCFKIQFTVNTSYEKRFSQIKLPCEWNGLAYLHLLPCSPPHVAYHTTRTMPLAPQGLCRANEEKEKTAPKFNRGTNEMIWRTSGWTSERTFSPLMCVFYYLIH